LGAITEEEETKANFNINSAIGSSSRSSEVLNSISISPFHKIKLRLLLRLLLLLPGVLKSAGYLDHALELARKYKAHEWYLRIQLEKPTSSGISSGSSASSSSTMVCYRDALKYISGLPFDDAEKHLRTYGKKLTNHLPEETTGVIIAMCTGKYRPSNSATAATTIEEEDGGGEEGAVVVPKARAENFMHLFVDHPQWLRTLLECVMKEPGLAASQSVANTLLELLLQDWDVGLQLPQDDPSRHHARKQKEAEVMSFLDHHHGRYDDDHALVLVQMHRFKPGQLFLHDKTRNVELVLDYYIAERDTNAVLARMGRKENKKSPDLWTKVGG